MKKRIWSALLIFSLVVMCFGGCSEETDRNGNGDDSGKQEKDVITTAKVEVLKKNTNLSPEAVFEQGYGIKLKSIIKINRFVFYIKNESSDSKALCSLNLDTKEEKLIAYVDLSSNMNRSVKYSELKLVFWGSKDGNNFSYQQYDVQSKNLSPITLDGEILHEPHFYCGVIDNYFWYTNRKNYDNNKLMAIDLNNGNEHLIFGARAFGYNPDTDSENGTALLNNPVLSDSYDSSLYFAISDLGYANEYGGGIVSKNSRWVKYSFSDKKTTNVIAAEHLKYDPTGETTPLFVANKKVYTFEYNKSEAVYLIENNKAEKISEHLPSDISEISVYDEMVYYTAKSPNSDTWIILKDNVEIKKQDSYSFEEEDRTFSVSFTTIFNNEFWYSNGDFLVTLNDEGKVEKKVLFSGSILNVEGDYIYCSGTPTEQHERTPVNGNTSTSYNHLEKGIYKVNVKETETETKYIDVFDVSEENKKKAIDILDSVYGKDILILVNAPEKTCYPTTYNKDTVTVTLSGNFRVLKEVQQQGKIIFSVDIVQNTCKQVSGTWDWDTLIQLYNMGY